VSQEKHLKLTFTLLHKLFSIIYVGAAFVFFAINTPVHRMASQIHIPIDRTRSIEQQKLEEYGFKFKVIMPYLTADFFLLAGFLSFFVVSTGSMIKRLETRLKMRDSGQSQLLHTIGIEGRTLADNKYRKGGVIQ